MNLLEPEVLAELTVVVRARDTHADLYCSKLDMTDKAVMTVVCQRLGEKACELARACGLTLEMSTKGKG